MSAAKIEGWPKVAGYCPACGLDTLFLGSGGWVTCSWAECPNPTAWADAMDQPPSADERLAAISAAKVSPETTKER